MKSKEKSQSPSPNTRSRVVDSPIGDRKKLENESDIWKKLQEVEKLFSVLDGNPSGSSCIPDDSQLHSEAAAQESAVTLIGEREGIAKNSINCKRLCTAAMLFHTLDGSQTGQLPLDDLRIIMNITGPLLTNNEFDQFLTKFEANAIKYFDEEKFLSLFAKILNAIGVDTSQDLSVLTTGQDASQKEKGLSAKQTLLEMVIKVLETKRIHFFVDKGKIADKELYMQAYKVLLILVEDIHDHQEKLESAKTGLTCLSNILQKQQFTQLQVRKRIQSSEEEAKESKESLKAVLHCYYATREEKEHLSCEYKTFKEKTSSAIQQLQKQLSDTKIQLQNALIQLPNAERQLQNAERQLQNAERQLQKNQEVAVDFMERMKQKDESIQQQRQQQRKLRQRMDAMSEVNEQLRQQNVAFSDILSKSLEHLEVSIPQHDSMLQNVFTHFAEINEAITATAEAEKTFADTSVKEVVAVIPDEQVSKKPQKWKI